MMKPLLTLTTAATGTPFWLRCGQAAGVHIYGLVIFPIIRQKKKTGRSSLNGEKSVLANSSEGTLHHSRKGMVTG